MFVVSGEALFDVYVSGATPAGLALDARVGGSPLNVAVGLARLGQPVAFFGALACGPLGERLVQALADEGVVTRAIARVDAPTTLGMVALDPAGVPAYDFYGERGADRQLRPAHLDAIPPGARAFQFGSYAMVVEPAAGTLRALVEREHRRSLIAYDPNIRLNVQPALDAWRGALGWMLPRTHLLKVSAEDLALLYPGARAQDLARAWIDAGVALVVVTHGADGAEAWTARAHGRAAARPVALADTVGAGDSFQAALLAWAAEHGALSPAALGTLDAPALERALAFACRAAAHTCGRRGADLPRRADLPETDTP